MLLVSLVLLELGCGPPVVMNGPVEPKNVRQITILNSDVHIPQSASNVWVYQTGGAEQKQMIRFDAPEADARSFAKVILGTDLIPGRDAGLQNFSPKLDWWLQVYPMGADGGDSAEGYPARRLQLTTKGGKARVWLISLDT
jgi:hypothetical protein